MSSVDIPALLLLLDEKELAIRYIDVQPAQTNLAWSPLMPVLDPIRCDPRFLAAIVKVKVKDLRAEGKELQGIWTAVQNSAGWRLLESLRRVRRRVLPTGTRRATWYESMISAFRRPTGTTEQFIRDTQISKKLWA